MDDIFRRLKIVKESINELQELEEQDGGLTEEDMTKLQN